MIRYILDSTGQILSSLVGSADMLGLNTPLNAIFIDTDEQPELSDYWNGVEFVGIGDAPSKYHTFDYNLKQWVDRRTILDLKAHKWTQLKLQRDMTEFGGFLFEGNRYDSDQISQGRIVAAASLGVEVEWTLQNNSAIWLSPAKLRELQIALAMHVTQVHARGKAAREAIYAATTIAEIEAVAY